jgi:tetratricopeptide (TPR) repeat protein
VTAEIWLLLGRHPDAEALYQWGAWYFDRQRQYPETALLLRQARLHRMDGPWLALHDTLRLIREGRLDEATVLLQEQHQGGGIWQIPANLGIIMESRRSVTAALDYYETAASLIKDPRDAARVQLRIAHCLHMMGRDQDSRRVLEYAQDLDPDNLNARLELRRLGE